MASPPRSNRRRAALFIGHLGFLAGFPDEGPEAPGHSAGLAWVALERGLAPARIVVDRQRLARSTRTLTKLRFEYRAAVDELVPDAERWLARVADQLDRLKPPIHHGVAPEPPPLPARIVAPGDRRVAPLVAALRWCLALTPDDWGPVARFVAAHAEALAARPLLEAVRVALVGGADGAAGRAWLAALAVPPVPSRGAVENHRSALVSACRRRTPPVPLPSPSDGVRDRLGEALTRRVQHDLVAVAPIVDVLTPALAHAAADWATTVERHHAIARRFALDARPTAAQERDAIEHAAASVPGDAPAAIAAAFELAVGARLAAPVVSALAAIPVELRLGFVEHWAELVPRLGAGQVEASVVALERHVNAGGSLEPWRDVGIANRFFWTPESVLDDLPRPLDRLDVFFDALTACAGRPEDCRPRPITVAELVLFDPGLARARTIALARLGANADPPPVRLELAHDLAGPDVDTFAALVTELGWEDDAPIAAVSAALRDVPGIDRQGLVELVRTDRGGAKKLGRALALARALDLTPPSPAAIAAALPPPEPLPDPHAGLADELRFLRSGARAGAADGAGIAARIAVLERRLATPAEPTAADRARHARRQARLVAQHAARYLHASIDQGIAARVGTLFAPAPVPPWLGEHQAIVAAVIALPSPYRELAKTLLQRRAGPPPWDLRDHPKNVAFLARIAPRVGSLAPWIDGERWTLPGGRVAALDPDPLAVLSMGEPFGTCLSPRACNFFSAVVNAADINKRVLFVRDARGLVIGRCLLALTAHGGLVPFRVYSTVGAELAAVVGELVRDLAAKVGVVPVAGGTIEPLLAPRWYDDGAVPLVNDPIDAELERALVQSPFDLARVEALFPGQPDALWLSRVIATVESWRPEVRHALRPRLLAADLSDDERERAAEVLARAGDTDAAQRILGPVVMRVAARQLVDHHHLTWTVADVAAATEPARFLRLLKRRSDIAENEWIGSLIARCLDALHRPRQAEAVRAAYRVAGRAATPAR